MTKVDPPNQAIFLHEEGPPGGMIFHRAGVEGVRDITPEDRAEAAQDQNEARSVAAAFGGWKA